MASEVTRTHGTMRVGESHPTEEFDRENYGVVNGAGQGGTS